MQNVVSTWQGLDARRRLTVLAATAAVFVAVLLLSRMAMQPRLSLLYAGLEPAAASDVIAALDQRGVAYDVRGDAIYAADAARDQLRIALAGEGLPANGATGYELLDGLSGFGTTSQMFDAAYWRAKEGELARTIMASPQVRAARVHIANPANQPFRRDAAPTASVFVTPAAASLTAQQAQALKFLVASAVTRLTPEAVSVIDSATGTVIDGQQQRDIATAEAERATELQLSVERLLEARVGPGRAVVEVRIEPQTDREQILERRIDPEGRVPISSEIEESTSTSEGSAAGAVTVASDLPDGDAGAESGQQSSQSTQTRERTNFEVSETSREILREPGGIRRLTVAVLVDGTMEVQADGNEVWVPRPEEELADMRELVASAVGFDEARGDQITIKSLAFEPLPTADTGTAAAQGLALDPMQLAQLGVLAAVALALGLGVVRPILTSAPGPPAGLPAPAAGVPSPAGVLPIETPELPGGALTGEIDDGGFSGPQINTVGDFDMGFGDGGDLPALPNLDADPVTRLKGLIEERQDETMEVLRGWMGEGKERA
ncbi:MAG: flagellar basal-body MS-ring/collar protein FliF [Pseudomonadota bacterium]